MLMLYVLELYFRLFREALDSKKHIYGGGSVSGV